MLPHRRFLLKATLRQHPDATRWTDPNENCAAGLGCRAEGAGELAAAIWRAEPGDQLKVWTPVLTALRTYYDSHGIGALRFACPHRHKCAAESPRFTTAKEAYIGPEYEKGTLPRLLFLSLDSGSADADPAAKTLEANREWMRTASVASFPQGRHWYETHALAWFLLRQFKPDLTNEKVVRT